MCHFFNFHSRTAQFEISKFFSLPTDAQRNCFKNNIKIYLKIAPTCFGAIRRSLMMVIAPKHVGAILNKF